MDAFVRELLALPVLDADRERDLARRARAGDRAAREQLITSGLRSVALRARMNGLRGEDLRDAVQAGTIGLIRAVDAYDPDRGARLATYAWRWIGAAMRPVVHRDSPLDVDEHDIADPDEERCVPPCGAEEVLAGLPVDQATVLRLRFGLGDPAVSGLPRREVAQLLGLTVSQVRTLEAKAMRHLRGGLAKVVHRASPCGEADPL
jgi:DNA-directed RNA polymerase sigma subunit (sigma70/sigma32)